VDEFPRPFIRCETESYPQITQIFNWVTTQSV
jgi:hypothetical protein